MFYFCKIVSGQQDGSEGKGMSHQVDNPSTAPGAHMEEEGVNYHKLSYDLHIPGMVNINERERETERKKLSLYEIYAKLFLSLSSNQYSIIATYQEFMLERDMATARREGRLR